MQKASFNKDWLSALFATREMMGLSRKDEWRLLWEGLGKSLRGPGTVWDERKHEWRVTGGATELGPGRLRPAFVTELGPTELGPTDSGPVLSFKG